ncbi:hypothetical protein NUSPORA_02562 [Nucleospora cyclopteri]
MHFSISLTWLLNMSNFASILIFRLKKDEPTLLFFDRIAEWFDISHAQLRMGFLQSIHLQLCRYLQAFEDQSSQNAFFSLFGILNINHLQ